MNKLENIFNTLKDIAVKLEDSNALEHLEAIEEGEKESSKMRILIAGQSGVGRSSILNILLEKDQLLPVNWIGKASIPINLVYSEEEEKCIITNKHGQQHTVSKEKINDILLNKEEEILNKSIIINIKSNILKFCNILIVDINEDRSLENWKQMIGKIDIIILVLQATCALQEIEKRFISDIIKPTIGFKYLYIMINKKDLIPESEVAKIKEYVETAFSVFNIIPSVIVCSAIEKKDKGIGELKQLILTGLWNNVESIRSSVLQEKLFKVGEYLECLAKSKYAIVSVSQEEIFSTLGNLKEKKTFFEERVISLKKDIDFKLNILVCEEFVSQAREFRQTLSKSLPNEIEQETDMHRLRKELPGYLESLWKEFIDINLIKLRYSIFTEMGKINDVLNEEINKIIGQTNERCREIINSFNPYGDFFTGFALHEKGKSLAADVAKFLKVISMPALLIGPIYLVLSYISGKAVEIIYRGDIKESDRIKIIESSDKAMRDVEDQLTKNIRNHFDEFSRNIKNIIDEISEQCFDNIEKALKESSEKQTLLLKQKSLFEEIISAYIPNTRCDIKTLS